MIIKLEVRECMGFCCVLLHAVSFSFVRFFRWFIPVVCAIISIKMYYKSKKYQLFIIVIIIIIIIM